jgi:hypothetical protein
MFIKAQDLIDENKLEAATKYNESDDDDDLDCDANDVEFDEKIVDSRLVSCLIAM